MSGIFQWLVEKFEFCSDRPCWHSSGARSQRVYFGLNVITNVPSKTRRPASKERRRWGEGKAEECGSFQPDQSARFLSLMSPLSVCLVNYFSVYHHAFTASPPSFPRLSRLPGRGPV